MVYLFAFQLFFLGINVGKYSSPMHMESMFWGVHFGCVFRIEQSGEQ